MTSRLEFRALNTLIQVPYTVNGQPLTPYCNQCLIAILIRTFAAPRGKILPDYTVRVFTGHTGGSGSLTAFKNLLPEEADVYRRSVTDNR